MLANRKLSVHRKKKEEEETEFIVHLRYTDHEVFTTATRRWTNITDV
jgi:hypothetical protein